MYGIGEIVNSAVEETSEQKMLKEDMKKSIGEIILQEAKLQDMTLSVFAITERLSTTKDFEDALRVDRWKYGSAEIKTYTKKQKKSMLHLSLYLHHDFYRLKSNLFVDVIVNPKDWSLINLYSKQAEIKQKDIIQIDNDYFLEFNPKLKNHVSQNNDKELVQSLINFEIESQFLRTGEKLRKFTYQLGELHVNHACSFNVLNEKVQSHFQKKVLDKSIVNPTLPAVKNIRI